MRSIGSVIALFVLASATIAAPTKGIELFVSPDGSDTWTGTITEPFATLEGARDAIRQIRKDEGGLKKPVTVYLRKGTYYLASPFALTPEDSGTKDAPITYAAYRGEVVVISGGRPIGGFSPTQVNGRDVVVADIPDVKSGKWSFAQLFANDRRLSRTRLPKKGYFRVQDLAGTPFDVPWSDGQDKFTYQDADIKPWKNLSDVDVVALHFWVESRMPIKSVDETTRTVQLAKKSVYRLSDDFQQTGCRYYVENVFEAMDTPGQWYLDRAEGKLYYYPRVGERVEKQRFIAPRIHQLVRVVGDAKSGKTVDHVRFANLRFAHTEWKLPEDQSGTFQAAYAVPGVIYFESAKDCAVTNCEISHIGNYAIEIAGGCAGIRVERNNIFDLGAGGVKIHGGSERTTVADNEIGDGGKIFVSAVGVWIADSPGNVVAQNHIHDLNYTGVSVGWRWGYGESKARDNIIEFNHIHHVGREVLSDLGGIYSLGIQPGTVERNNLIHDCISASYGGWGVYTDEGSSHILIENNIVYNTKTGGFHQHYGAENTIRNNVFAFATNYQLQRTRPEEHKVFTFERNIVYFNDGVLLGGDWSDNKHVMDYNVYWNAAGKPFDFAGKSFEDWKKQGQDANSIIADPKFVNPKKYDFRLRPDSPALKLGFKPIDVSKVGPRVAVGPVR
jgi:parallel beta-helix repeat protein